MVLRIEFCLISMEIDKFVADVKVNFRSSR